MVIVIGVMTVTAHEMPAAAKSPSRPPSAQSSEDSMRNWRSTCLRRAPSAFRSPISNVRSVTETSMMFITTMPPTTSAIRVIGVTTIAMAPVNWSIWLPSVSVLTTPKSSSSLPMSLW